MTTIRVTRRPPPPPPEGGTAAPQAAVGRPEGTDEGTVRLALIDPPAARTTLDGAWWPRTLDLGGELPALVSELHRRGVKVTRVAYSPDAWEPAARRLQVDGRTIRLGWFRGLDRQLVNLSGDERRSRLDLLVVPPGTLAADVQRAFSHATDRANHDTASALLGALGVATPPPRPRGSAVPGPGTEETPVEPGSLAR